MSNIIRTKTLARPGDIVLAHTKGLYGAAIRVAQWIRWKGFNTWNHAAIVVSNDAGVIKCVEMAIRCELITLDDIAPAGKIILVIAPDGVDRERAVAYALRQVGTKYGVLTILSILFNLFTPNFISIDFRRLHTLICSALVARSLEHGGATVPYDPFFISPAQLAEWRNV
jgi:hypothetical protein